MLVYYHIPKTAGTSCKRVLESWYPTLIRDSEYSSKLGSAELADGNYILTGHFASRLVGHPLALLDLAPDLRGASKHCIFTILRDPLEHAVSAYYHLKDIDRDVVGGLIPFLERGHPFLHSLALGIPSSEYVAPALDSFSLVGDTADIQRSLDLLADFLEKPRMQVPSIRMGTRDPQLLSLTAAERSRFEQLWPLEFEIYEAARDRLRSGARLGVSAHLERFAYLEKTQSIIDTTRARLELLRNEAATTNAGLELVMPELSPEMAMLLSKKEGQIRELESKLAAAEERRNVLLSALDSQRETATEQRNSLVSKLHAANERYASLKQRVEEREKQIKESRVQIHKLTRELEAAESAHTDVLQKLRAVAEASSNTPAFTAHIQPGVAGAGTANFANSGMAWQAAMATFMRDLEDALSDIRTTVGQLDAEPLKHLTASSAQEDDADDAPESGTQPAPPAAKS